MNELKLSNDINVITAEINSYKQIAGQSIWEIGRRLNYVKENDLAHGEFIEWVKSLGMNLREAQRFMKVTAELPNTDTWSHLGNRALYLITTLPEEERTKQHITSKGEAKTTDEMTVKELQELKQKFKQKLKQKDEQINNLSDVITEMNNKEPKVVEKEVVIEKIPNDYTSNQIENKQLKERLNELEGNYRQLLKERQETDEKSSKYEQLNQAINQAKGQLTETQQLITNYKKLLDLLEQSNAFLSKASALVYQDLSEVISRDGLAKRELDFLTERLEKFLKDLKNVSQNTIIEGVVINE